MQCSRLTQVDFDQLTLGAQVLEADSHGAKVYPVSYTHLTLPTIYSV